MTITLNYTDEQYLEWYQSEDYKVKYNKALELCKGAKYYAIETNPILRIVNITDIEL